MIETYAIIALALLAAGMSIGITAIVSVGVRREERIHREEKHRSVKDVHSPSRAASAARAFHSVYTRTQQVDHRGAHQRDNLLVLTGGGPPA
jgi:hypothetical protein